MIGVIATLASKTDAMPSQDSSWIPSLFFRKSPIATDLAALVAAVACAGGSGWLGSACDGCSG